MKQLLPWSLVVALAAVLVWSHSPSFWETPTMAADEPKAESPYETGWAVYDAEALVKQRQQAGRAYLPFLQIPTLYCGIYGLPKDGKDGQSPHKDDEIYYVLSGKGSIQTGSGDDQQTTPFAKGGVIYVKAGMEHRFVDISEDLELLVFFSTAKPE